MKPESNEMKKVMFMAMSVLCAGMSGAFECSDAVKAKAPAKKDAPAA